MSKQAAKAALNRLARQKHAAKTSDALIAELNTATDRTFAIIEGALVEDALRDTITRHFRPLSNDDDSVLFGNVGPLSTFGGKILVAYAMKAINATQRSDLSYVKDIRNAFAHATVGLSFSEKAVIDVCELLKLLDIDRLPAHQRTAKWRFSITCGILRFQLSSQIKNMYLGSINVRDLIAGGQHSQED